MPEDAFVTQMDAWARKSEARMLAIWKESTQRAVSIMQSRIPVDTGFARASLRASTEEMPKIDDRASKPKSGSFSYDPLNITLVIAGAKLGDIIYLGYTANYVEYLERGHSKQAPAGFIRVTALEWPRIVSEVTALAKARVRNG